MPAIRPEVSRLSPYEAGRPIEEVAREFGFSPNEVIKLASNESPEPPFPEAIAAIAEAASSVNRYPDNGWDALANAVGNWLSIDPSNLMFAGGSSELLRVFSLAVAGSGTSTVYPWPSFIIYRLAPTLAGSSLVEVPLTSRMRLDPEALVAAVRTDTTLLFLCNPNNPTGTYLSGEAVDQVIENVPENVLVVVDEAYFEYVTAPDYRTAISNALARPNVVVTRTFSKIFGLAALRVGYAVGQSSTLRELRRAQAPFTVGSLGQAAAIASLQHPERIWARQRTNEVERTRLAKELLVREIKFVPSQANFTFMRGPLGPETGQALLRQGVIVREFKDWIRVTIGTADENDRFLRVLDGLS
ncbi:MAG: histidinol-phosphate transaminase [Acidimicrobiia bacterium]